jgi:hypothetical protein
MTPNVVAVWIARLFGFVEIAGLDLGTGTF